MNDSLPDQQNEEISIEHLDESQNELSSEAEQSGGGRGAAIKEIWENNVSDMNQFSVCDNLTITIA